MLTIELPAEIESRLAALAQSTGRSTTSHIQEAILEHLDDLEDLCLARQRLAAMRSGQTKAIPIEEVMARYGMED